MRSQRESGRPASSHVALDTRYGKVKAFHTTWTKAPVTDWAESPEEAKHVALALAGGSTVRPA